MKSNKLVYTLATLIFFLFATSLTQAASVGSSIFYTDGSSEKTITEEGEVYIEAYGHSVIYGINKVELILHDLNSGDKTTIYEKTGLSTTFYSLPSEKGEIDKSIYTYTGDYKIMFKVHNSDGETASESVSLTVEEKQEENNPPKITSSPVTEVNENSYYEYNVQATDQDGDDLTYSLEQSLSWLSISSSGLISGNSPEVSQDETYNVKIKVSDGKDSDTQSYTLTVKNVPEENTAPSVEIISPTQGETFNNKEITVEFDVQDSEDNLDSCEYELNGITNSLSCSEGTNTFDLSSNELNEGSNTLTIYAEDSKGEEGSDSVSFTIDTEEPNNPPTIENIPSQSITQGESFDSFDLDNYATDQDGDKLTFSYSGNNEIIVDIDDNNVVSLSPPKLWTGKEEIKFTVTDSHEESDSTTASFEVTEPVNNPPKITSLPLTETEEETYYEYRVKANDADGDDLTYTLEQAPSWLLITSEGRISGMAPDVSQDKTYDVKAKVSDGKDYDSQSYTLTVKDNDTEDTTPPEITVVSPEQGESYTGKIRFLVYLNEQGSVEYKLDDGERTLMTKDGNMFTSAMLDLSEGEHEVTFYAKDEAENKANKIVKFSISEANIGDSGTGDSCYKKVKGKCFTYEDYLYYKQHTNDNPLYIDDSDSSQGEDKDLRINWLKTIFWILLVGVVFLFLVIIKYAWKATYAKNLK